MTAYYFQLKTTQTMEMTNTAPLPEPTVNSVYGYGWNIMKKNFVNLLLIMIVIFVAQSLAGLWNNGEKPSAFTGLLSMAYWLFVLSAIQFSGIYLYLKAVRGESYDVAQIFDGFKTNYKNIILANLLTTFLIGVGFVLLIVPGIFLACRLAFVPYLVMDKQMDAVKALEKSWEMTRGYGWTIFLIGLLAVLIIIAGLILFIIGVIVALMWVYASFSAMYYAVDLQTRQVEETASGT